LAGYKNFVAGEEALATDVNGLLMGQTVARFTNASQRAAAITAPVLNQLSMLDNKPGVIQRWNGSAWLDIEGGVSRFANAAARASAIPAPVLNQLTMRDDNPLYIEAWNGTAWVDQQAPNLLFGRETNIDIGSPGIAAYDISFVMPRTGSLLLTGNTQIGLPAGYGNPPNGLRATIDNGVTSPPATAVLPGEGTLTTIYGTINLMFRAYWGGIAKGTTVYVRLIAENIGGPATVNWVRTNGLFNVASGITTF
jgi:hypothetical protein